VAVWPAIRKLTRNALRGNTGHFLEPDSWTAWLVSTSSDRALPVNLTLLPNFGLARHTTAMDRSAPS